MKDIARDLGVSVVTVSKVLRKHTDIGEETRERVLKRVKELNYRPNLTAQSLVTGRSYLIGLVVPDLVHPFFAEVAKALSTILRKKGYYLIISSSEEDVELEEREIDQLLSRSLDALIIASASSNSSIFARIEDHQTPYILIDREFDDLAAHFVGVDDEQVGFLATNHLIEVGCKRIAHIRGSQNSVGNRRLAGYQRALKEARRKLVPELVIARKMVDVDAWEQGYGAMKRLLSVEPPPDGVFCYNDPLAVGVIDCLLEAGLRVPEDVAVIGCGNMHFDSSLKVGLSSIDQASQEIGERAAKLVLEILKSKPTVPPRNVVLKATVVARQSTGRLGKELRDGPAR